MAADTVVATAAEATTAEATSGVAILAAVILEAIALAACTLEAGDFLPAAFGGTACPSDITASPGFEDAVH